MRSPWVEYLRERFPLPVYLTLVGGFVSSGAILSGKPFSLMSVVTAFFAVLSFFGLLRLMDEFKDYDIDLIAHPERPLPRGLLGVRQVKKIIIRWEVLMLMLAPFIGLIFNWQAASIYILMIGHLWLMYKEFYVSEWIEKHTILYAFSHQLVLIWVCSFCVVIANHSGLFKAETWWYGTLILGSFFTYEICRKLDPRAHEMLRTYRNLFGLIQTGILLMFSCLIACLSAWKLGLGFPLWIASMAVVGAYCCFAKKNFKTVESVATLSLVLHLWTLPLLKLLESI
ncbi:MAG: UbiA family prenyltransferase [Oligoflexales bacterium]